MLSNSLQHNHSNIGTAKNTNRSETFQSPQGDGNNFVSNIQISKPTLWAREISTTPSLARLFNLRELPPSQLEVGAGEHFILIDDFTREADIKAVGWRVQQAGGFCFIRKVSGRVAFFLDDLSKQSHVEIRNQIDSEYSQSFDDWVRESDSRELEIREALEIARSAIIILPEAIRGDELKQLGKRCKANDWQWNKDCEKLINQIHPPSQDRLRLELLALSKESDPIAKAYKKQKLSETYKIRLSELDNLMKQIGERERLQESKCYSIDELFDLELPGIDYVIPGMLPVGETIILAADPKCGKSLLAYDAAFAVATGEDYFLGEKCKQGRVLIIQCDESINTAKNRLMKRGFRREDAPNIHIMDSFNISQLNLLEDKLEAFRPTLVIIDSLKRITVGSELSENSAEFADNVYLLKEIIGRYNASGILIHHANSSNETVGVNRVRGSKAIVGATWGVWLLSHIPIPDPNNPKRMKIDPNQPLRILDIYARDTEGQSLKIELDPSNNQWVNHGRDNVPPEQQQAEKSQQSKIIDLLHIFSPKGLEAGEISDHLGIAKNSIYTQLNRLVEKRIIGVRPSSTDRRRSVYFATSTKNDNPPPPPLSDFRVIQSSETITVQGLQSSITDSQQIYNSNASLLDIYALKNESTPCTESVSEIDNRSITNTDIEGGGECVINSGLSPTIPVTSVPNLVDQDADKLRQCTTKQEYLALCDEISEFMADDYLDTVLASLTIGERKKLEQLPEDNDL